MINRRTFIAAAGMAAVLAALPAGARAEVLKEMNFGVISTEAQANLKPHWLPFLAAMEKQTGIKVNAFFAPDYAGVIEGMRFNKVQVAWFGNASAIQAVDRASGEVFVQSVSHEGNPGYWSLLLVHKDSPLNSLPDLLKSPGKYTFGNGDPNSTSGFHIPSFYVFAQNHIEAKTFFTRVVTANHETNALAVANKQVDVATNNTENMERLEKTAPEKWKQIKIIWKSPLIPSDPLVWRKDLSPDTKTAIKTFLLTYGTKQPNKTDAQVKEELAVLGGLQWSPFRESSNKQLIPIREIQLFREKTKIQADDKYSAEEKASKIKEIDAQLDALHKEASSS